MPGGACCILEVCCPPDENGKASPEAAGALAEWLAEHEAAASDASYEDIAVRLLGSYRLVPRTIDAGPSGTTDQHLEVAQRLLEHLERMVDHQLRVILELAGHPIKEG